MSADVSYALAPPGWAHTDPNPFTTDGSYDRAWSAFCLLDRDDDQFITGQEGRGPFSARFGRNVANLDARLADFLRYEAGCGRRVIVSAPVGVDAEAWIARALAATPPPDAVRPGDPAVVIHATTETAWQCIQADGAVKAANQIAGTVHAERSSVPRNPVEEYLLREPPEYPDYIMFGEVNSIGPEMVVASYAAGKFLWNPDAEFIPGVRLYFDNHRIIRSGLAVRDGLHVMKVFQCLPLESYLLAGVGRAQIDPHGTVERWTVRAFVDGANRIFWQR